MESPKRETTQTSVVVEETYASFHASLEVASP